MGEELAAQGLNPITHTEAGSSAKCLQSQHEERRELETGVPEAQWPARSPAETASSKSFWLETLSLKSGGQ